MRRIKSVLVTMKDAREGTYTYEHDDDGSSIGGKPSPSESQAWAFGKGIAMLEHFMGLSYDEKMVLIKQYSL